MQLSYIKVRRKAPITHLFLIFFSSSIMMKTYFVKLHVDIYWSRVTSISQSFESKQHFTLTSYYSKWESPSLSITQSVSLLYWVLVQKWKYTVKVSLRITCLFAINFELFSEILNSSWNLHIRAQTNIKYAFFYLSKYNLFHANLELRFWNRNWRLLVSWQADKLFIFFGVH